MKPNKLVMPIMLAAAMAGGCHQTDKPEKQERATESLLAPAEVVARARADMQDQITDLKAEGFNALVPNSRVREMARTFFGHPVAAGPQTWAAHEIAYTSVVEPEVYDRLPENVYLGQFPHLDLLLYDARSVVMEKAKAHLSEPSNLMAFYESKKPIILDELRESLEYNNGTEKTERITQLQKWMKILEDAINTLEHEEFDNRYQVYLEAEEALTSKYPEFASQFGGLSEVYRGGNGCAANQKLLELPEYKKFLEAEEALKGLTPDLEATLFAARRQKENPEILQTYLVILEDLRGEVESIR